jgi:hypothetical protein
VTVVLAARLGRSPAGHGHWRTAFWWFGLAALAGAVHHGLIVRSPSAGDVSWTVISVMVVVAVSYLLAGTVAEVLGPGRRGAFWLLRSIGIVAYLVIAVSGNAGIGTMLACEALTMVSVLALWVWAAHERHPLARPVLVAILVSSAAAGTKALSPELLHPVGLDPTSVYHLAQIAGMVLLFMAVSVPQSREPGTAGSAERYAVA